MRLFLLMFLLSVLTVTHLTVQAASKHLTRSGEVDSSSSKPASAPRPHKKPTASQPGKATIAQP